MTGLADLIRVYDRNETIADGVIHVVGLLAAVIGVTALLVATAAPDRIADAVAAGVYGFGLVGALTCSLLYNLWPRGPVKWILRRFDHSAIFLLIAGTYTPFLTRMPEGPLASALFAGVWGVAIVGVILKCTMPGRLDRVAIVLYLALGWSGIVAYPSLGEALGDMTLPLILAGGIVYSAGVVFHVWDSLRYQNAIWHGFVVTGAAIHYAAVFNCLVLSPVV